MLKQALRYYTTSTTQPLEDIHVSKVAEFRLRVLNVYGDFRQIGLMKMWEKRESSIRTNGVKLIMCVTFWTSHTLHANKF